MIDAFPPGAHIFAVRPGTHPVINDTAQRCRFAVSSERKVKCKMKATSTSTWEEMLNASKRDDKNCSRQRVEEQQVEPGTATEGEDDSIDIALQQVVAEAIKTQVEKALKSIPDFVEEAVEQLFRAPFLNFQRRIPTKV